MTDGTRSAKNRFAIGDQANGMVFFTVDGRIYSINRKSIMAFPHSNLARFARNPQTGAWKGSSPNQPIPYDAEPEAFRAALNFYRYGILERPIASKKRHSFWPCVKWVSRSILIHLTMMMKKESLLSWIYMIERCVSMSSCQPDLTRLLYLLV